MDAQLTSKMFRALGTMNTITVYHFNADEAISAATERVMELHNRFSVFQEQSEIARLNQAAGKKFVPVSKDTLHVLKTAKQFSERTEGAFSVTSRPLTDLWKIGPKGTVPSMSQVKKRKSLVNDQDILLDEKNSSAMLRRKLQAVDLGGIAKGYAADEVRRILSESGVTNALINLGGTVLVMGEGKTVGIQHPRKSTGVPMGSLQIQNQAVVTSGDYERYFKSDGIRYHHILDPKTGYPAESGLIGITLIGTSAMELDALSTAMFVMGMEKSFALAERQGIEAVFITEQMDVLCSPTLRERFSLIHS